MEVTKPRHLQKCQDVKPRRVIGQHLKWYSRSDRKLLCSRVTCSVKKCQTATEYAGKGGERPMHTMIQYNTAETWMTLISFAIRTKTSVQVEEDLYVPARSLGYDQ